MAAKPKNTPAATGATETPVNRDYVLKGFKVKTHVTVPVWKWEPEQVKFFTINEPIHKSAALRNEAAKKGKDGKEMEPADVAKVTDLQTGNVSVLIFGTVLAGNLRETYPSDGYVGKSFSAVQHKVEGKRYRTYTVAEIEAE